MAVENSPLPARNLDELVTDRPAGDARQVAAPGAGYTSPLRLVSIMIAAIFFAEMFAMLVLYLLPEQPYWQETLLDSSIMVVLIFPVLYYFSFRPLLLQVSQNRRLLVAEQRAHQVSETLSAVTIALTRSLDLDMVMQTLLEHICRMEMCDRACIAIVEDDTHLTLRAMLGYEGGPAPRHALDSTFDTSAAPYLQEVITSREPLLIPNTHTHPGWSAWITPDNMLSWLGIPILVNERVIGVLVMMKEPANFFTKEHVRLARMIVGQASVAIQNAWLFEQLRSGHERLQALSLRMVEVQESERRYIARELHDDTSQSLTALMFGLQLLEKDINNPDLIRRRVAELEDLTNTVLEDLHRLAMNLRPASLDHLGLVVALEQLVKGAGERYGLQVHFKTQGVSSEKRDLPDYVETTIYRIVQEALTNAARHAHASNVDVIVEQRFDRVVVVVEDNGVGFDPAAERSGTHLGLVGMQERAQIVGGSFQLESQPGNGTTLVVEVPYDHSHPGR